MKKVSFFPIITLFILLINSFIVCAEEVYPPGEIYAVEKIITDSYPDTRQRAQNAKGSWKQDSTGWWWEYPDGSYAINNRRREGQGPARPRAVRQAGHPAARRADQPSGYSGDPLARGFSCGLRGHRPRCIA